MIRNVFYGVILDILILQKNIQKELKKLIKRSYVLVMSRTRFRVRFTLKSVRDMTRTCSQMHRTGKYSEHSSII